MDTDQPSFLARHEFLVRRLHSLSGLIPVGAYMVVHLLTNLSVADGPNKFQSAVYAIHSLGSALPIIEWGFIFIPILFHAVIGVVIIRGGLPNTSQYPLPKNIRYTLQRATGMIAFAFIVWHVLHMHGWLHFEWWESSVSKPLGGANFKPYNAASSAGGALLHPVVAVLYAIGMLSCVFHLANGLWTMGITWGVWISPAAQRRADYVCIAFGVILSVVGLGALFGMRNVNQEEAVRVEDQMYEFKLKSGELKETPEKRTPKTAAAEQNKP